MGALKQLGAEPRDAAQPARERPAVGVASAPSRSPAAPAPRSPGAVGASPTDALSGLLARAVRERAALGTRVAARPAGPVLQRVVEAVANSGDTLHTRWGDGLVNVEEVPEDGDRPIVIELMTNRVDVALEKVAQVGAIVNKPGRTTQARIAIAILLNGKVESRHLDADGRFKRDWTTATYTTLTNDCRQVADRMAELHVLGACVPAVWRPTGEADVYPVPYLEMRARLTLHPATQRVVKAYKDQWLVPLVRGMDADVSNDPLLEDRSDGMDALATMSDGDVLSGGYDWDTSPKPGEFWPSSGSTHDVARWNSRWARILTALNRAEHLYRTKLLAGGENPHLLYWPEPNIYMTADDRSSGAGDLLKAVKPNSPQMRESIFYVKRYATEHNLRGKYDPRLKTTKPAKDMYFTDLRQLIIDADSAPPSEDRCREVVEGLRQTHLSPKHISDIQKSSWYGVKHPTKPEKFETYRKAVVKKLTDGIATVLGT